MAPDVVDELSMPSLISAPGRASNAACRARRLSEYRVEGRLADSYDQASGGAPRIGRVLPYRREISASAVPDRPATSPLICCQAVADYCFARDATIWLAAHDEM